MTALAPLIEQRIAGLPRGLALRWPGGRAGDNGAPVQVRLHHRQLLAPLSRGEIGVLAAAYVRGEVDIEGRLSDVMAVAGALAGDPVASGRRGPWLRALGWLRSRWLHTPGRDTRQVRFHYDIGDKFYGLWLDPLRVYSCAYYADPQTSLAQAQQDKLELVCRKLQLGPGQRFLDIGAGWGGLLLWAAQHHGVQATGITLSQHQHAHISRLIRRLGLGARVQVHLQDYRSLRGAGEFDRIASVGMFEHVGQAQMAGYFSSLRRLLRPGGLLLNHAISAGGLDNAQLGAGMGDFIARHIFPGGELVHVSRTCAELARGGLELVDAENLRPHYARTLWDWSDGLEARLDQARALTDEATVRAYRLYLAGAAMCFERGWLALYQLLATLPSEGVPAVRSWARRSDYPYTRAHMLAPQLPPQSCRPGLAPTT